MEAEREFVRAFPGFEREFINVHFARRDHALRRGDAENGLGMILRLEPNGMQNRAAGRAVWTVNKDARKGAQIILFHEAAIVAENLSRGKLRMRVAGARRCGRLNSELQMRVCLDRLSP